MLGEVLSILDKRGKLSTEKLAIIVNHQLASDFPKKVLKEADDVAKRYAKNLKGRIDLRTKTFVTIDGSDAKDFDDAISAEKCEGNRIRLFVSIADVSLFVREGSELDRSAYERSTSVYFPGECIPMLPAKLSNGACSLRPNECKSTITMEMLVEEDGSISEGKIYRSTIKTCERMTYSSIKKIFINKDAKFKRKFADVIPMLKVAKSCFKRLRQRRLARGSIDFDLPEAGIEMDMEGEISNIIKAERHIGHMMIEEFMISANEMVAIFLADKNVGCIYRIHEPPPLDKMKLLSVFLNNLGFKNNLHGTSSPKQLARIIAKVRGLPEERLINHVILRSMSQAIYSETNIGHYGLASSCYCHFTSPIRRYPDLVVHRLLLKAFPSSGVGIVDLKRRKKKKGKSNVKFPALKIIAEHCSRRERIAMAAEREILKMYSCIFMRDKIGNAYKGIISHVTRFGFYVELLDFFVEGIVNVVALDDNGYELSGDGLSLQGRKRGSKYRVGDRIMVKVDDVDIANREISLSVI